MKIVPHIFTPRDLVAGHPAVDFTNTVTARDTASPLDWLDGHERLLDWATLSGLVDAPSLARLRDLAAASPREARIALERAKQLREALHQLLSALVGGHAVPSAALEAVQAAWKRALRRTRLVPHEAGIGPWLSADDSGLDLVADAIALAAIGLVDDFPFERARLCRGTRCGWLFIDSSKGGHRIWCDMATCGNAAKSRRHYERRRHG